MARVRKEKRTRAGTPIRLRIGMRTRDAKGGKEVFARVGSLETKSMKPPPGRGWYSGFCSAQIPGRAVFVVQQIVGFCGDMTTFPLRVSARLDRAIQAHAHLKLDYRPAGG